MRYFFKEGLSFCSIDKVPKVSSPVLVIHGTEDEVIDFSHGLAIYEKCPKAVEPLWVEVGFLHSFSLYVFISFLLSTVGKAIYKKSRMNNSRQKS